MSIGVIADIHGNREALRATLAELRRLGVDRVLCLGDFIDPLPGSREVLESLIENEIPCIRGNHEDYVVSSFRDSNHKYNRLLRYRPIQMVAETMNEKLIGTMERMPLSIAMNDAAAGKVVFCHASPSSNLLGWCRGVSQELGAELDAQEARLVVCGHWHDPRHSEHRDVALASVGSVGIPFGEKGEAEFSVVYADGGRWRCDMLSTPYDLEQTVFDYADSGWLDRGGPVAWLLMAEIAGGKRRLSPFITRFTEYTEKQGDGSTLDTVPDRVWREAVREYLIETNDWAGIEKSVRRTDA